MYNISLSKDELITLTMAIDAHYDWVCAKIDNDAAELEDDDLEFLERKACRIKALLENILNQEHKQDAKQENEDKYW